MRDTDKTLAAFVTVAVITIISMVATIGVCNQQRWADHQVGANQAPVDTEVVARAE